MTARVAKLNRGVTPASPIPTNLQESYVGLELADPTFFLPGAVALVLGPEVYSRIILPRVISQPGLPTAQYSIIGWIISGTVQR